MLDRIEIAPGQFSGHADARAMHDKDVSGSQASQGVIMEEKRTVSVPLLIFALMLAEITCSLESSMIFVALSPLYAIYGDPISVGWLVTAFTLSAGASAAIGGRLGDLYGRRRMLIIMLAIGFVGSLMSAVSDNLTIVIAGRVLQGATMAILPLCFGLLREHLASRQLAFGVSLLGATYSITVGLGTMIGGLIIDHFSWHAIFIASAATAAAALVATLVFVPPSPPDPNRKQLDVVGGILFAPAVAAIFLGLTEGARNGWFGLAGLSILVGLILLAVWIRHELRHPNPLIELRLLGTREVAMANLAILFMAIGPMMSSAAILPLLQQPLWAGVGFALTATAAGAIKLGGSVSSSLSILAAGGLAKWINVRTILLCGALLNLVAWSALTMFIDDLWIVTALLIFLVMPGSGIIFALIPHVIINAVPPERTSEATGICQVVRSLGVAVGAQTVAMCLSTSLVSQGGTARFPTEDAYILLYGVIATCSALAVLMLLFLPTRNRETPAEESSQASPD